MNKLLAALAAVLSGVAILLAAPGQHYIRVNAGGPTLRMLLAGRGGPTVVFEAGAGSSLEAWASVQPEVSKFARTISYDRAGNGLSEKGAVPRDGRYIATELHVALHNAHVSPPYLLVGHSLGGQLIVTENSGHGIPFEEPELVIKTIRDVANRARLLEGSRGLGVPDRW